MAAFRELAGIRARLGNDPTLAAIVPIARIYPRFMADVNDPVYPAITLASDSRKRAVWHPSLVEPCTVSVQIYSQIDVQQCFDLYTLASDLLHHREAALTNAQVRFYQCHEIFANSGVFDEFTKSWQLTARYAVRFSWT